MVFKDNSTKKSHHLVTIILKCTIFELSIGETKRTAGRQMPALPNAPYFGCKDIIANQLIYILLFRTYPGLDRNVKVRLSQAEIEWMSCY